MLISPSSCFRCFLQGLGMEMTRRGEGYRASRIAQRQIRDWTRTGNRILTFQRVRSSLRFQTVASKPWGPGVSMRRSSRRKFHHDLGSSIFRSAPLQYGRRLTLPGRKVAVLGGGVGGMSAAHELAERGFNVTVYDRQAIPGGKARSIDVPGSGVGGRRNLPGEHGFRFFPGFYQHVTDTMKRIPYGNKRVFDNIVHASAMSLSLADNGPDMTSPAGLVSDPPQRRDRSPSSCCSASCPSSAWRRSRTSPPACCSS